MTEIIYGLCVVVAWIAAGKFLACSIQNYPGAILGNTDYVIEMLKNVASCLIMVLVGVVCLKGLTTNHTPAIIIYAVMIAGAVGFIATCAIKIIRWVNGKPESRINGDDKQ